MSVQYQMYVAVVGPESMRERFEVTKEVIPTQLVLGARDDADAVELAEAFGVDGEERSFVAKMGRGPAMLSRRGVLVVAAIKGRW